jgi:hypothetical protein
MLDFLCDLAGHEVARRWAADVVADPAASMMAKQNGLAVTMRLGPGPRQELAGVDLRDQDLTNRDFQNANLQGADLRGMRLVRTNFAGADLRGADLTAVRMVGGISVARRSLVAGGTGQLCWACPDSATSARPQSWLWPPSPDVTPPTS